MMLLATIRGLAIASTFVTTGSLISSSVVAIPSILTLADHDTTTASILAQQFSILYRMGKITQVPAELFSIVAYTYLAYESRAGNATTSSWKLYTAAATSMFLIIPWTRLLMEDDSQKIVALVRSDTTQEEDYEAKIEHGNTLRVANTTGISITPVEEFEPYEDSPFSAAEYEKLKVISLLKTWNTRNIIRVIMAALAGTSAMSAITTRVTLLTIIQGQ